MNFRELIREGIKPKAITCPNCGSTDVETIEDGQITKCECNSCGHTWEIKTQDKIKDEVKSTTDDDINEMFGTTSGYDQTKERIYGLEKSLSPNSKLCKAICKEIGDSYKDDFEEMSKHLDKIIDIWKNIEQYID